MNTAAYRYAQAMAVTERARGRAEEERAWLDLLALLDAPAPAPSVVPEAVFEAVARALSDDWNPGRDPVLTAMFRDYAHTALTAALPFLTAAPSATRDEVRDEIAGHPIGSGYYGTSVSVEEAAEIADTLLARFTITPKEDR